METLDIQANWEKLADGYEQFSDEDSYSALIEWDSIKKILPALKGRSILDLGCGNGSFSFLLEKYGPKSITGMDISEKMIQKALANGKSLNSKAKFLQNDIQNLFDIPDCSIDFVLSSTVLHYVKDPATVIKQIYRVLKPGGTCILSIIHPVYSACYPLIHQDGTFPKDTEWTLNYLDKSLRAYIQPWIEYNHDIKNFLSYSYHHTVSDYVNSIIDAGLRLACMIEPMPPERWKKESPDRYRGYMETPVFAIMKAEKDH